MKWFKTCMFAALLTSTVLGVGPGEIRVANSPKAEAAMTLWYCDVSLTMQGRTYRGYLGGYRSRNEAQQMYNNWARGVGSQYRPRLNRIFSQTY